MARIQYRVLLGLFILPLVTHALQHNITIDDAVTTGIIPAYFPSSGAWKQGASCSDCFAQPDPSKALGGTWHDATFTPSDGIARAIEFSFNGTALYVFFILANSIPFADTLTNTSFILDEEPVGAFLHEPSTSSDLRYNVPVFVNDSLPSGQHHIRMEAAGNRSALILFDYLIYTAELEPSSTVTVGAPSLAITPAPSVTEGPKPKASIGPIIGGTIGGIVGFSVAIAALLCYWKYWKSDRRIKVPARIINQQRHGTRTSDSALIPHDVPEANSVSYLNFPSGGIYASDPKNLRDQVYSEENSQSAAPCEDATVLRERLEFLLDEVARLRHLHLQSRNEFETVSETLPGYSEGCVSPGSC